MIIPTLQKNKIIKRQVINIIIPRTPHHSEYKYSDYIHKGGDNRFFERPREPSLRGSGGSSDYDPQEKFLRF